MLKKQSDMELYYKFSPLLMQYIPKETVTAWIMKSSELEPMKLIPALVQYDHDKYREQVNIENFQCRDITFIFNIERRDWSLGVGQVKPKTIYIYINCDSSPKLFNLYQIRLSCIRPKE